MDGTSFDHLAKTVAARGSRRPLLGALLVGALGSLRLRTAVADDSGTAIADASGGNHNLASAVDQARSGQEGGRDRDRDKDNNHDGNNKHNGNDDNNHDRDDDNEDGGGATCKAAGESCGITKGDGFDSSCCTGICVERGECSARSGCGNNSCDLASGYLCCYGATCDSAGNCVPWD